MKARWLMKKIGAELWDHRADIEYAVGTGLVISGSIVAMTKAEDAVKVKHDIDKQVAAIEQKDNADSWESGMDRTKACVKVGKDAVVGYGKVYAVPVGMQAAGITLQTVAHKTQKNQIMTLSTNLAAEVMAFAAYRQNVRNDVGEEKDEEYLLGKAEKVITSFKDENGNDVTVEETTPVVEPKHSFWFRRGDNKNWEGDPVLDVQFLENREFWVNDKLQKDGVIYENDIRRMCGAKIDPDAEGWGATAVDDDGNVNYISLGLNKNTARAQAFRDGTAPAFLVMIDGLEPRINTKLGRLMKYHKDWDIELKQ